MKHDLDAGLGGRSKNILDRKDKTVDDCKLMNEKGKTIAMGSRDRMFRYLKHHAQDGTYAIEGPGIDMTYYRIGGVVYPCGGKMDGVKMPTRNRDECRQVFGTDPD